MTCCCGIFCSRFLPILSPLKISLEMIFWTNLMLDLICAWLEKTRRFCRQVNKKISSCFWTASTCVQRSSLGWCLRLTYKLYGNRGLDSHYTCGFVLTCMQTEEIEMHASTKIIVVTGFTTELHAGRQRVHFSILQPFLLTTYGNNRRLEDIVSDK